MRFLGRSLVGLMMLAVTVGLLAFAGHGLWSSLQQRWAEREAPRIARERVFAANVVQVQGGRVEPELTTFGEVRSRRTLDLRAPRGGRVIWLADGFADGAAVEAGQLLVRLDPADAMTARALALADRAKAEAEGRDAARALELARDELAAAQAQADLRAQAVQRQQTLLARGVGSEAALETAALAASSADQAVLSRRQALAQAESRVDQAASGLARLDITLAEAERALRDTEIRAGFAGRLSEVAVVAGGLVGQNEQLARIIDPEALEVAFRLSTSQYARLLDPAGALIAAPVAVSLDVLGAEVVTAGRLERVGAAVGAGQSGRLIYAALEGARGFRPGDFVTVRLREPALEDVAVLPAAALGAGDTVLVLGADDRLELRSVDLLRRQGDQAIIRVGDLAGREVVAERTALLGAGIRVRPIRPDASAGPRADSDRRAQASAPDATAAAGETGATVALSPERRAAMIAFVEGSTRMPPDARSRLLAQLALDRVPAEVVAALTLRMGG